jgi:hypothetical protein
MRRATVRSAAPIFAYVRAAHAPINERDVIVHPGLVVVANKSLASLSAAGVLHVRGGVSAACHRSRSASGMIIE